MRNSVASTVRVIRVPKSAPPMRFLSLEEEALAMDQSYRDQAACSKGLDEANRLTELSDALEDLAEICSRVKSARPSEIALIQTAGQAGVAGTTNEPEMLLPALESFVEGKHIAFESIAEKAKMLMKNLLEFIARLWEKFIAFFRVNVVVKNLKQKSAQLKQMLESGTKGIVHQAMGVDEFASWFTYNGKLLKRGEEMGAALVKTAEVAKFLFDTLPQMVLQSGQKVETLLANFKPETSDQTLKAMVQGLAGIRFDQLPSASGSGQDGEYTTSTCTNFIGGGKLVVRQVANAANLHPYAALDLLRNSGITFERGSVDTAHEVMSAAFEYPKGPLAHNVLRAGDTLLDLIVHFHETYVSQLKATADKLKAASTRAAASLAQAGAGDDAEVLRDFKSAINFNTTYARWSQNPAMPFYSATLKTVKFALMLVQIGIQEGQEASQAPHAKEAKAKPAPAPAQQPVKNAPQLAAPAA